MGKVCLFLAGLVIAPILSYSQTTYYSRATGNWDVAATWSTVSCNGAVATSFPGASDHVVICATHTVLNTGAGAIVDLTVNANSTFDMDGSNFVVTGDVLINGQVINGGRLRLDGVNTDIDGLGSTDASTRIEFRIGDKNVLSTANLTFARDVQVQSGVTVTNYGTVTTNKNLNGQDASSVWINESNSRLNVAKQLFNNGILTASATGNTVNYNQAGAQAIKISSGSTYFHLELQGNNIKSLASNTTILGDLTITSTLDVTGNNWSMSVGGNWSNSGTFVERLGTVTFDGSGAQSITNTFGEVFHDLIVNKSGGILTMNNDVTVSGINPGTLTMTLGNIDATSGKLILGDACGNPGTLTYTSGQIIGQFERWINTSWSPFLFPVGTSSNDRPANITFIDLSPCGSLIAEFVASGPGSNGLPLGEAPLSPVDSIRNTFVEGYWAMTAGNGLGSIDYNLDLEGNGFTSFPINSATRLLTRANAGSAWTLNGAHSAATGDTTHRTNINMLSAQYAFGDSSNCAGPTTSPISGADSVCTDDAGVNYSVTNTPGSSYNWTVTGGSITSGQGLDQIAVTWGSTGMIGNVQVVENNGCTQGSPVNRAINIHTMAPASIAGDNAVAANTDSVSYSVTARPGYTYTWSITGGTLILGQGTDSILVKWGAQGSGNVRVVASTGCGSATPLDQAVNIYTTIISIASGDWDVTSTWDCNCVPAQTDNVVIADPHVVTLTGNERINNFEIRGPLGQLADGGGRFQVSGNLTVNGLYTGTNRLELMGTSVVNLSGTGTISNANNLDLNGGNVIITAGTNLSVTGGSVRYRKVLTVTNNGSISFDFDIINTVMGTPTTVTWVNEANSTLNIGGALLLLGTVSASASGNTINYNGTGIQTIRCTSGGQYYNLTASNAGTKTLVCNLDLGGNLNISGTAQLDVASYDMTVAGNWSNTSSNADPFFERSQIVTFDGTGAQSITYASGETFFNMVVNKAGGILTLNDAVTASNALTMSAGNIDATVATLTLGTLAGDGTITRTGGTILGRFKRYLSTGGNKLFPIGVSTDYRPSSVTLNTMTSGSLLCEFVSTTPGVNGLFLIETGDTIRNTFTEGYWSFTVADGLTSTSYDLDLTGNGFTSQTVYNSTRMLKRANSSSPWTLDGAHVNANPATSTAKRTGMSGISGFEFCFGDTTQCASPLTSIITGLDSVCIGAPGVSYLVDLHANSSYIWVITGGTQVSGTNTNSITVNWNGAPGQVGKVQVVESDNCGISDTVNLSVNIHTLPTSVVTGRIAVAESSTGVDYSVTNTPGYTYNWYITKGTQASGGTTNAITVNWGAGPDTGKVQVVATTGCGAADTSSLSVIIYQSIHSVTTGDWSNPLTWDCSCIPAITDNVVIDSPHLVTLTGNITANNLEISVGSELSNSTFTLDLNGEYDYIVHGTHSGTGITLLQGTVTYWGGTGNITNTGDIEIKGGSKEVIASTTLTKASGDIRIDPGIIVNNFGSITFGGDIIGLDGTAGWTNQANSTLNAGGALLTTGILNASATGNTVGYTGSASQTVKCPSSGQYYHLTAAGSSTKTLECNVNVDGDLTISSTLDVDAANNYSIDLAGNWNNTGTFNRQSGTVTMDGSGAQSLTNASGETFNSFTVNKSAGVITLSNNVTIAGTLTMTAGNIDASSGTLTLGTGAANVGSLSRTSGTIIGNFERWFNTPADPAPPVLYPVGTSGNYRPVNLTLNTLSTNGRLTGAFATAAPGNNGVPIVDGAYTIDTTFTEGYWTLVPNGLSSTDYNLELIGSGFTSFTMVAETRILKRASGGAWANTGWGNHVAADPVTSTSKRNNLSGFGEFAFGDTTACAGPPTSAISGADSVCTNASGSPYSVDLHTGNTYFWVIIGGTQASGGTTNSITVDWGGTGQIGTVRVTEVDACIAGAPRDTAVNIHSLPTSAITGNTAPQQSATDPYTVIPRPGYSYAWSVVNGNGAIVFGQGSDSIRVNWTATGTDIVRVVASTACGSAPAVDLPLQISGLITSTGLGGGNWTTASVWDCNCVPTAVDNVIIIAPDIIATTANDTVNRLTVGDGAIFDNDFTFIIDENFIDNGTVIGSGDIHLDGIGSTISGTGTIGNTGTIRIRNGDKSILGTATLTRAGTGDVRILSNITVTNNGSLTTGGNLVGANAGSTWTQGDNSTLTVSRDVLIIGTLNASATGNTVNYNGTSTQQVKDPGGGGYYNLANNGADSTKLNINMVVGGDVIIGAGKVLDANGFNMNVGGNWTNTGGTFKARGGSVTFTASGVQTITNAAGEIFNDITISSTSTVQTAGASDNINVGGTWTNNGTFNQQTGMVTFNGTTAQTVAGSTKAAFYNLTISNAAGVALTGAMDLTRTLSLTSGTFSTGGQVFTLISNSSGTANIGEITGGAISGDITMQRYIAGDDDWRIMTSPVSGSSLSDWNVEIVMSGFPGSNDPPNPFISVFTYNETLFGLKDIGYEAPSGTGDGLGVGKGFFMWVGDALGSAITKTVDLTAPATTGAQVVSTSYTDDPATADDEDGWNFIGNPYPSDILWDGVVLSNVRPFAYVWDPNGDSYIPYDQLSGNKIPSMQAFWVKNDVPGGGTVTFNESDKTTDGNNFYKTTPWPGMCLTLSGNGMIDSTRIRINDQATQLYDPLLDAYGMYSLNKKKANISTVTADSIPVDLSINSIPEFAGDMTIPVRIGFSDNVATKTYTIKANLDFMPEGSCILLEDVFTNTFTDLRVNSSYTFTQQGLNNLPPRFMLHIGGAITAEITDITCKDMSNGQIVASAPGGNVTYNWFDENNNSIQVSSIMSGPDTITGLSPGNYTVVINTTSSICPVVTQTYSVTEPSELTSTEMITEPLCNGDETGIIDLTVSGATPPYVYQWTNGKGTEDIDDLADGNYEVTILDDNGCSLTETYQITSPGQLVNSVSISNESCEGLGDGSIILTTAGGVLPYQFLWSDSATDPVRTGLMVGTYSVTTTDWNGCTLDKVDLVVEAGLQVMAGYTVPSSTISLGGSIQFNNISVGASTYTWDFGNGELSALANPLYTFPEAGDYEVKMTAFNGLCSSMTSNTITVFGSVGISGSNNSTPGFLVFENKGMLKMDFSNVELDEIDITVRNILGQLVFMYDDMKMVHQNVALDLTDLTKGVYMVHIVGENVSYAQKFTIK